MSLYIGKTIKASEEQINSGKLVFTSLSVGVDFDWSWGPFIWECYVSDVNIGSDSCLVSQRKDGLPIGWYSMEALNKLVASDKITPIS